MLHGMLCRYKYPIVQIAKPIIPAHFTACQCGATLTIVIGHKQLPAPLTALSIAHTPWTLDLGRGAIQRMMSWLKNSHKSSNQRRPHRGRVVTHLWQAIS